MLTYVVRRLLYSIPVLLVASFLVFVFVNETTDPTAHLRQSRDPRVLQQERHRLGLDKPLVPRYFKWLKDFARGKWGDSFITRRRVSTEIKAKLWTTVQLIIWGVAISAATAIAIGVYSAVRQYSALDYTFTGLSFVGLSMPPFWFGLIAIELFSFQLAKHLGLSRPFFLSIGLHSYPGAGFGDYLRHLALPVATLTVQIIASWSRFQRSSMLDVMSSDYIRTARAKGVPMRGVIFKHALR